jgi:NAD(P)-dependent dehydrogenase (short-subunit alcohol dehydrogenase family)
LFSTDSLQGKQIVLAGGAGGIGSVVAEALHSEGAQLTISYHSHRERAEQWADRATVLEADLAGSDERARLLDAAPALYGLVVLAGDPVRDASMQRSHDVNYAGPILLAREAADRMKASSTPGAIVLISTMQANALFPGSTVYAAQKAALQHAGLILAKECRGKSGIRVNVVSPGITAAGMAQASIASGKYDQFVEGGVIGRFGHAEDVARAVRFFLEPDNYITGQVLCVDGGITL